MKRVTLFVGVLVCMLFSMQLVAQQKGMPKMREDGAWFVVEKLPEFPGGQKELAKYFEKNVCYPEDALAQKAAGWVTVNFVVEADGSLSRIKVMRGVHPSLDAEAIRLISAMPRWIPGMEKGKKVPVVYNIPIAFRLPAIPVSPEKEVPAKEAPMEKETNNTPASLQGFWQLSRMNPTNDGNYEFKTLPYLKILANDGQFTNMYIGSPGAAFTAKGTYRQTSDSTYVESIVKSATDPKFSGKDNELQFKFYTKDLLMLSFQATSGQKVREMWVRVGMPKR